MGDVAFQRKGQKQQEQATTLPVYWQWSRHSRTETSGHTVTPAAACAPGIVANLPELLSP